jgi:predicted aspartyl protease
VKLKVNNMDVNVMLDSGATHIFLSDKLVEKLGLQFSSVTLGHRGDPLIIIYIEKRTYI